MLYCSGAVPPVPMLYCFVITATGCGRRYGLVINTAGDVVMVTNVELIQLFASFTTRVYTPAVNPVKKLLVCQVAPLLMLY